MIRVLVSFGTRPEAIKMAPLVRELRGRAAFDCRVCVTAQHRQMLDGVLSAFGIAPDYDLDIMRERQTLSDVTSAALVGLEGVIRDCTPDIVLVHGDTATAFAGALAAFYQQTRVGHVEAGLRTWQKYSPFPEEMYRQMVDNLADLLFAPTETSRENLLREGKDDEKIFVTGNTEIDALKMGVRDGYTHPELDWLAPTDRLIVMTAHRRENLGEPMRRIFRAVRRVAEEFTDVKFIYPVHMNPAVRETADEVLRGCGSVRLIEPLVVTDFYNFMARAYIVLTDSGGIQEGAPALGKPVLVVRDTTERPEGVAAGTLRLVGTEEESVYRNIRELLCDGDAYARMSRSTNPYGDGFAGRRIADAIAQYFAG